MFICSCCSYETPRKDIFDRHKLSNRHIANANRRLLPSIQETDNEETANEQDGCVLADENSSIHSMQGNDNTTNSQKANVPIHICDKCGKKYKTKSSFINHYEKCNFINSLQCPKCLKCFKHKQSKQRHIKKNKCKGICAHNANGVSSIKNVDENYIYLLHLREFRNSNKFIYKIGKTKQQHLKRFAQYPKGSKLIMYHICNDCDKMEKELLKDFASKYIHRKDIGKEYFEGNFIDMTMDIYNKILSDFIHS